MNQKPLIVDLDGTLINTDLLHESSVTLFKKSIIQFLQSITVLLKGKAKFKNFIAEKVDIDISLLPFNKDFLDWLSTQKDNRKLILCTGSNEKYAKKISKYLNLFDEVIASNKEHNMVGLKKAEILVDKFGKGNFQYAGNSHKDIPVWIVSDGAIVVNGSNALINKIKNKVNIVNIFNGPPINIKQWLKALRAHQWLKNLLLFAPMIAAHMVTDLNSWIQVFIGFISFSFCASSIYLINDIIDLENDRAHPRKRKRPFASGSIPFVYGLFLLPVLICSSFFIGSILGNNFIFWLTIYLVLTLLYSFVLKPYILIDVITLAMLYTIRIIAGAATLNLLLSPWILAFSILLFVSLAFVKRYAELEIQIFNEDIKIKGRGYMTSDASLIQSIGTASSFASILVFILYLNSPEIKVLYEFPEFVWLCIPVLIFWQSWMWLNAHRGQMHDDPIMFAVKDITSILSGLIFISILLIGALGIFI
jgi:4-hydroxybenzoate polyprenyltransferase